MNKKKKYMWILMYKHQQHHNIQLMPLSISILSFYYSVFFILFASFTTNKKKKCMLCEMWNESNLASNLFWLSAVVIAMLMLMLMMMVFSSDSGSTKTKTRKKNETGTHSTHTSYIWIFVFFSGWKKNSKEYIF